MLIKSQDGRTIVNTDTFTDFRRSAKKIYCSTTYSFDEIGYTMGEYDTEDEAQAALDKVFEAVGKQNVYDMGGGKNDP